MKLNRNSIEHIYYFIYIYNSGYYDQSGNFIEQTQEEYEISKQLSKVAVSDVDIMEQIVNERNEQIRQLHVFLIYYLYLS